MPKRTLLSALVIAVLALAGTAYAGAPAHHGKPVHERTIRLVEATATPDPVFLDLGEPGPSAGDQVVFTDGLRFEDGTAAGELSQVCTLTKPGPHPGAGTFECIGSIALENGTLTIAGPFSPGAAEQAQAVTGGTGAFRTARGETTIRAVDDRILVRLVD